MVRMLALATILVFSTTSVPVAAGTGDIYAGLNEEETANGAARAVVGVNHTVNLEARVEMPPNVGEITQFTIGAVNDDGATMLAEPQTSRTITRTISFWVHGQRDGLAAPNN